MSISHHYMVPIVKMRDAAAYEVNIELIQNLIRHIKMQILNFDLRSEIMKAPRGLDLMQTATIQSKLW